LIRVSNDEYRTLSLTSFGRDVMAGRVDDVQMVVPMVRPAYSSRRASRNRSGVRRSRSDGAARGQRARPVRPMEEPRSDQPAADAQPLETVFEALRAWRLEQARRRAVAPFVIMHDRTLAAIATSLPRSIAELDAVPGIGPAKLAAYGDAILSVVTSTIA
jgi:ATP-dependent DNA helicase RecQ